MSVVDPDALYEVTVDGEHIVGPVTLDQLRRGAAAGRVPSEARARLVGARDWTLLPDLLSASASGTASGRGADAAHPRHSVTAQVHDPDDFTEDRPRSIPATRPSSGPGSDPRLSVPDEVTRLLDPMLMRARTRLGMTLRGKWRLDVLLGMGGMAAVYAATHRNGSRAAVKILHAELSTNPLLKERFVREGLAANAVGHDGAVKVIDDDVAEDGSLFLVTELLDGETLEERRLRFGGTLDEGDTLQLTEQILDVLVAAHAKGMVHRDLKPENVFLTRAGQVKVLDFGIARLRELSTTSQATQAGTTMGTPAFMAPEQARGLWDEVDARTDLWAIGATMFNLLTGRLVHEGRTTNELLLSAMTKPAPPIASVLPSLSPRVTRVVDRALAFEKGERWSDALQMQDAVRLAYQERNGAPIGTASRLMVPDSVPNRSVSPDKPASPFSQRLTSALRKRPLPRIVAITATAALVLAGIAGVMLLHAPPRATPVAASLPRPGRPPATPAAAAAYEAAIQAQHDGNDPEADRSLEAAVANDPALGAAYLRLALYWINPLHKDNAKARAFYQKANEHRATLGEIDEALLWANAPRFAEPPDRNERTRRLEDVAKKFPRDVLVQTDLAWCLHFSKRDQESMTVLDRAFALDPHYVPALLLKIEEARLAGDDTRTLQLLDECVNASASAIVCLRYRGTLLSNEGRCADYEADARRGIAIDATSPEGYAGLAEAMQGAGEPVEVVGEAMHRMNALIADPDTRHLEELRTLEILAVLKGDFRTAEKANADAVVLAATRPSLDATDAALDQVDVVLEEGDTARARVLAKALQARISASASREHNLAREGRLDALLKRAGAITRDQLRVEQERLLAYQKEADERGAKSDPFLTWTAVYASDVVDEAAAADALTALPKFGGPDPRYTQVDPYGRQLGVAYAYGGRGADAVPLLERMQRICAQNSQVLGFTRGWYALGLAKEQTGDLVGARAAYQKVLDRWGSAKPRSVTADKAGASLAALAAASSPAPAQARADAPPQQSSHSTRAAFDDAVRGNLSVAGTCVPLGAGTPRATLVFKRDGSVQALAIDEDPPKRITRENEDCIRRALIRTRIPAFAGPDIPTWTVDIRRVAPTSP